MPKIRNENTNAICIALTVACLCSTACAQSPPPRVGLYSVYELAFTGPEYSLSDTPARDVSFHTKWQHQSGSPSYSVHGFWDGGSTFKVRFCPTKPGVWTLVKTTSNVPRLDSQNEQHKINCVPSSHKGFWIPDETTSRRWYKRSDGSHDYIIGNTMYSFLSEYKNDGPTGGNITDDVVNNSKYFKKIRFSITGDRYPHPDDKPFLDDRGKGTDDGNFSHRPNPAWFSKRLDLAVQTAFDHDLIADLILNGPDTVDARSVLQAGKNNNDCTPILRYIAARYGSYPNVWICLANEFDIKKPKYTPAEIVRFGTTIRSFLPCDTPVSVHSKPRNWYRSLNEEPWHDHIILQKKIKKLPLAADFVAANYSIGGFKPVIDDELAYEGKGDGWSEADVIESHLGAFMGAGYGTTGHKPAAKQGHYFRGNFKANEHRAADNLKWLRETIDKNTTFWKMTPVANTGNGKNSAAVFSNLDKDFRVMAWPDNEYLLATNKTHNNIKVRLPEGKWQVTAYDIIKMTQKRITNDTNGAFAFDSPPSRAVLFHLKPAQSPM